MRGKPRTALFVVLLPKAQTLTRNRASPFCFYLQVTRGACSSLSDSHDESQNHPGQSNPPRGIPPSTRVEVGWN